MNLREACQKAKKEILCNESDYFYYHDAGLAVDVTLSASSLILLEVRFNQLTVLRINGASPKSAKTIVDIFLIDFAEEKEGRGRGNDRQRNVN